MKIDFIKAENYMRIIFGIAFFGLAALSVFAVFKGNYYHLFTGSSAALVGFGILKHW